MARLLLCAFSVSAASCLIPQDDEVIAELPPLKNRPPRIVATLPATFTVPDFETGTRCTREPFSITVEDIDTGDTLNTYWFIDKTDSTQPFSSSPAFGTGSPTRSISQPSGGAFLALLANLPAGTHTLTVFVVDRLIDEITDGNIRPLRTPVSLPDGEMGWDEGYKDEFTWVIHAVSCSQ